MNPKKPLLIAVASGLAAFILLFGFFKTKEMRLNALEEPVVAVVAKKDISEGERLSRSQLALNQFPRRFVQPAAASSFEEVEGLVAVSPLLKGEQILQTKLLPVGEKGGISQKIAKGMRAFSVETDEVSGVSGLIRPNNFVDILVTFEMEDTTANLQTTTHTLVQRVLVLAVDTDAGASKTASEKNVLGTALFANSLSHQRKKTLTLALTPKQVQEVEFAKQQGTISFSLRPQWEEEPLDLQPTSAIDVVGFKGRSAKSQYREYRGK